MNSAKINRIALVVVLIVCALLRGFTATPAEAQVTGATLSGVITDASGSAVANAKVSIKNVATGVLREVNSNTEGFYTAPNLLPGEYEITVSAGGFGSVVQKNITLTVGAEQAVNVTLRVGNVAETVVVSDAPPTVQTTTSTISATVDSNTIRELPLNGRDWTSLATLEPGVISIPNQVGTGFSANKGNRGFGNQLSNSGHRANENTYRVNGIVINDYANGAPGGATGYNLGVDGIQEFSVLTSNYAAEYGRTSGAVINAITKSGVNQFHGTGFFFDRDKIFDAKNYWDAHDQPIPSFRRIQFGASGGTAIVKDKSFLYGAYEGIRQNQPLAKTIFVPTQQARSGTLCTGPSPDGVLPCPSRAITIDPKVTPYLGLWPCPTLCQSTVAKDIVFFTTSLPGIANENYASGRFDQKLSESDSLAVSYFWDSGPFTQPDPLGNAVHSVFSRRQMASVEETHIFNPRLVNTFRAGLSRVRGDINLPVSGDAVATNSALAVAPGAVAPPEIRVTGLTNAIGLGGLNRFLHRWTSMQVDDDAFITLGTHSVKLGFAFERMQYNILEQLSPNGRINTYGSVTTGPCAPFTSSGFCRFLRNENRGINALSPGNSREVGIRESLFAGYFQDDWRFRPNLTLNLGLRYEMTTLPKDSQNMIQEITTITNCATPGVAPSSTSPCGPVHVDSFIAKNPTIRNFEPRIGFAWDPWKNSKTAVRGGFGMFDVLPLPYVFGLNTSATAPYQIIGVGPATLGNGTATVDFNPNTVRNRYVQQDPKRAYVMNWNFNIQHELAPTWTAFIGYVGSRSLHLSVAADDINLVPPVITPAGILIPLNSYQLIPNWGGANGNGGPGPVSPRGTGIRPVIFDGQATYHGLQTQLRKTYSHGLQGQVSYTFGKCRDTSSAPVTGDTYVNSIAVPLLLSKQYRLGACDFDLRHLMVGTLIWEVPGPKSGIASSFAGGWELGTIVSVSSGSPFTPTIGLGEDVLGTGFNGDFSMDFASIVPGCNPIHGGTNYLNLNCFALPTAPASMAAQCAPNSFATYALTHPAPAGRVYCSNLVGNAGRNSLYGPGLTNVDFSAFKNFQFTERFRLQFRAEFFNVLNHPNLAAPNFLNNNANNRVFNADGSQPSATLGVLGAPTTTSSRQIQLGLKLVW